MQGLWKGYLCSPLVKNSSGGALCCMRFQDLLASISTSKIRIHIKANEKPWDVTVKPPLSSMVTSSAIWFSKSFDCSAWVLLLETWYTWPKQEKYRKLHVIKLNEIQLKITTVHILMIFLSVPFKHCNLEANQNGQVIFNHFLWLQKLWERSVFKQW